MAVRGILFAALLTLLAGLLHVPEMSSELLDLNAQPTSVLRPRSGGAGSHDVGGSENAAHSRKRDRSEAEEKALECCDSQCKSQLTDFWIAVRMSDTRCWVT